MPTDGASQYLPWLPYTMSYIHVYSRQLNLLPFELCMEREDEQSEKRYLPLIRRLPYLI